jgi:hypothetical protein
MLTISNTNGYVFSLFSSLLFIIYRFYLYMQLKNRILNERGEKYAI